MTSINLIDHFTGGGEGPPPLVELRLGEQPAMAQLFTAIAEPTRLHYLDDETVRAYVACPGTGCPVCYTGSPPKDFYLLPVLDIESGLVKVLRVPGNRWSNGLPAKLLPYLQDPDVRSKVFLISRIGSNYTVESRPNADSGNRGDAVIKEFLDRFQSGLRLSSAFPAMSPAELAEVPKVANRLSAFGGWQPPPSPGVGEEGRTEAP